MNGESALGQWGDYESSGLQYHLNLFSINLGDQSYISSSFSDIFILWSQNHRFTNFWLWMLSLHSL